MGNTMKDYLFRSVKLFDAINLSNLFYSVSSEEKKFFNPHKFDYESAVRICTIASLKLDQYYIITNQEGIIVGYGFLRGWQEGYDIPRLGIYLDPSVRGKGLGKEFLKYLINSCPALNIQLKVHKDNFVAMDLYESFGFYVLLKEKDYLILEKCKYE